MLGDKISMLMMLCGTSEAAAAFCGVSSGSLAALAFIPKIHDPVEMTTFKSNQEQDPVLEKMLPSPDDLEKGQAQVKLKTTKKGLLLLLLAPLIFLLAIPKRIFMKFYQKYTTPVDLRNPDRKLSLREFYSAVVVSLFEVLAALAMFYVLSTNFPSRMAATDRLAFSDTCFNLIFVGGILSHVLFYKIDIPYKLAFTLSAALHALSLLLIFVSPSTSFPIFIAKFLGGMGSGFDFRYVPSYLNAISPKSVKGLFLNFGLIGFSIGSMAFFAARRIIMEQYDAVLLGLICVVVLIPLLVFMTITPIVDGTVQKSLRELFKTVSARRSLTLITLLFTLFNLDAINLLFTNQERFMGADYEKHMIIMLGLSCIVMIIAGIVNGLIDIQIPFMISCAMVVGANIAFFFNFEMLIFSYVFFIGHSIGVMVVPYYLLSFIFPPEFARAATFYGVLISRIASVLSVTLPKFTEWDHDPMFLFYAMLTTGVMVVVLSLYTKTLGRAPAFQ